jgi:peptidoglycan/LPS O-acetylase OafA/YrhL
MMNLVRNLKWGLRWGLIMAVGFTVIGIVATIGASFDPTPRNDPSLASFIGFYFLAGIVGGLLLGLLRPVTRSKVGAMLVGTAVAAVSIGLLARMFVVTDGWTLVDTIGVALYSLVTGPVATLLLLNVRSRRGKESSDPPILGQ